MAMSQEQMRAMNRSAGYDSNITDTMNAFKAISNAKSNTAAPQPVAPNIGPPQTTIRPQLRPQPQTRYISFRDRFDGGGPGRSGARFSSRDTGAYDTNNDGYVSEAEYAAAEANNPNFSNTQGGIAALSNMSGARPRGSYGSERALGQSGTNIGTSGIADYVAGGGMFGPLFGSGPTKMQQAMPNMEQGQQFTYQNLINSGMTHQQAMQFLGMPMPSSNRSYSPRPMLRPTPTYGPPTTPQTVVGYNMGGLMALRDYNMGMQMGMGQSV